MSMMMMSKEKVCDEEVGWHVLPLGTTLPSSPPSEHAIAIGGSIVTFEIKKENCVLAPDPFFDTLSANQRPRTRGPAVFCPRNTRS